MKNTIIFLLILALLGLGAYVYMSQNGHTLESIMNIPNKIDLEVDCSAVEDLLVTSTVTVTVTNTSERTHNNVNVRITAYDEGGNIVKEKQTIFSRTLEAEQKLTKPITLPAQARRCDCVIVNSDPS